MSENEATQRPAIDFSKIVINDKSVEDVVLELNYLMKVNPRLANKQNVLNAINNYDLKTMREISDFFYKTSGLYARMLKHMAYLYRYDWFVTPFIPDKKTRENEKMVDKITADFDKVLKRLDNFRAKKNLGNIALKVLRQGVYYAYKIKVNDNYILQELPIDYCRSRYLIDGDQPVVEFKMSFFDTFSTERRQQMLKLFPPEFSKGYALYKKGKLNSKDYTEGNGWYTLDPKNTVKFNANGEDYPAFIAVIPLLLDLTEAQEMDKKKTLQNLIKLVIQQMPLDKNGEQIFYPEEVQQMHNNVVRMIGQSLGLSVVTTYGEMNVASLTDGSAAAAQADNLERVERQVFNEWGGSHLLFNTDGNVALEKSLLNDEATMYDLILQFEHFLNSIVEDYNKPKYEFGVQILTTTIYNYKELAKLYKEQTQTGFSKMLPQVALGQSQRSILANAYFENEILDLINVFIPPLMSSTMNGDVLNRMTEKKAMASGEEGQAGRKEKPDDEKSEKTLKNIESQG